MHEAKWGEGGKVRWGEGGLLQETSMKSFPIRSFQPSTPGESFCTVNWCTMLCKAKHFHDFLEVKECLVTKGCQLKHEHFSYCQAASELIPNKEPTGPSVTRAVGWLGVLRVFHTRMDPIAGTHFVSRLFHWIHARNTPCFLWKMRRYTHETVLSKSFKEITG